MRGRESVVGRLLTLAICTLGMLLGGPAHAEDKVAARAHWESGTKFYDLGKYDDAIREFEAAYQAKSDPAFLYNLAQSHRLAGHSADALRFYRTYLRNAPRAANRADIEQRIAELEKVTSERPAIEPTPVVPPLGAPPPAAPPPAALPADSNAAPGWTPPQQPSDPSLGAAPNTSATGPGSPAPSESPAQEPPRSGRKTAAVVIAASGGAVFLLGAVFGAVARSQSKKVETTAQNSGTFDPSVESLGKSSETLQWVGYGLGLAAVATGVVLYVTAPKPESGGARVALAPLMTPRAGGALLRVSF